MLSKDLNLANTQYQGMYERVLLLHSKILAESAFVVPELLTISKEKLNRFFSENDELKVYEFEFADLIRTKDHKLTKDKEELLAWASPLGKLPYNTFSLFENADIEFPVVKDEEGNDIQISHGRYSAALFSTDREYRERVYKGYYKEFKKFTNTIGSLFNGNLKARIFTAKARKFKSTLEAALDANNIPTAVYDNLISTVEDNLQPMHRWCGLKKSVLKYEEIHPYDAYVTLFPAVKKKYHYPDAEKIVKDSLMILGDEYSANLEKAFNERWIDVYETKGKRSGAYSSGTTFGIHPYVLLNWNEGLNDVFTLTHEMGHNMHSYYTGKNQPYPYANYPIFLAEVASTFNEALLLDYLIEKTESVEEELYLIEKYLTNITTTFYRQTMFAHFEKDVHDLTEKGNILTPDKLCKLFGDIYQKYWGPEMKVDEEETYTWSRVPHFYYNFYVYQYATGYAASEALVLKVKTEGKPAVDKYMNFLKAGSSDYAINILRAAGVDMTSPDPVNAVIHKMNSLLDRLEEILESDNNLKSREK